MPEHVLTNTDEAALGQVNASAAEVYEDFFVPSLFGQFAAPVCAAAGVAPGHRVLDVACGTGAAARAAADRAGPDAVTGLDCNAGMLAIARRKAPGISWREGVAEAMPFGDATFDAVLCQFGLMFFEDRSAALHEMRRVTAPGGRAAVAVWDRADASPGYAAMIALIERRLGTAAADALRAPFVLGDREHLKDTLSAAGWGDAAIRTHPGTARFGSIAEWVHTEVRGWTLADMIDDDDAAELTRAAQADLAEYAAPDGRVEFAAPAHIAVLGPM